MNTIIYILLSLAGFGSALADHGYSPMKIDGKEEFSDFIARYIPLRQDDGKISIPDSIKHIKLDIGLSYSAPMSQHWLAHEDQLFVFGFEPNIQSVMNIKKGAVKLHSSHGEPLETKYIDNSFFLVPCALGLSEQNKIKFYVTTDCGCCSVYQPSYFEVADIVEVPIFPLSAFFDLFPFDTHPVIEYIKIDAQGADLDIVKSAGNYLKDRVVYITIEPENHQYLNTTNSEQDIEKYMLSMGFTRHRSKNTQDPTYFNVRFSDYIKNNDVQIFQKG